MRQAHRHSSTKGRNWRWYTFEELVVKTKLSADLLSRNLHGLLESRYLRQATVADPAYRPTVIFYRILQRRWWPLTVESIQAQEATRLLEQPEDDRRPVLLMGSVK